jgi:hypothetical protein
MRDGGNYLMFRWVGLVLALGGGIMAVVAGFSENWKIAVLGVVFLVIGIFAISRPNL